MRAAEIVFIVRKQSEAELLKGLDAAITAGKRLIIQIAGEPNTFTQESLRRLRRSPDSGKRRVPVVVWAANNEEADRWRNAGALTLTGSVTKSNAARALESAFAVPWIETSIYVGPDRRLKKPWLKRSVRRLSDSEAVAQPDRALVDASSFDTRMRQLRFAAFGIDRGDRERRAQFLVDAQAAVKSAESAHRLHAAEAMKSLVRYLTARGASASLDQELIDRHISAAEAAPTDAAALIPRLQRAVDRAIGLV